MSASRLGKRLAAMARKLALPAAVLVLWSFATDFWKIHPIILPALDRVLEDFGTYGLNGVLAAQTAASLRRCLLGFVLGSAGGIGLGIVLGWYNTLHDYFDVAINFLRSIPKTALAPLFLVWFGFGDLPKVLLVGLASFFYTLITTIEGVSNVDALLIKSARSMGASSRQILTTVVLPAAMPAMHAGLRLAAATSLVVLVTAEMLSGNDGLGYLLEQARGGLNMSTMYMALIVLGVIGFSLDWCVRYCGRKLMPWRKGKTIST
jgi:ABC-type nitrate/sulfonate/bicarbonate transport system permease component